MIRPAHYEKSRAISQSDLKLLKTNIQEFYKRCILGEVSDDDKSRKRYFDVGDLTDVMWIQPELKKEFYCMENISLGDKFKLLMDELHKLVLKDAIDNEIVQASISNNVADYLEFVKPAAMAAQYYYNPEKPDKPWSRNLETIQTEVLGTGSKYFQALIDAMGKIVVNMQDWNTAVKCVDKINTSNNKKVAEIVKYVNDFRNPGPDVSSIQVVFAKPLFGNWNGVQVKVLPDLYIINHTEKWIWPLDLKTCKSVVTFPGNYRAFKYGKQGAFYSSVIKEQPEYAGYTMRNFGFVVVGSNPDVDDRAEYYEMSAKELHVQRHGMDRPDGSRVRGIDDDIEDLNWHITNNEWCRYPENSINDDTFILETLGAPDVTEVPEIEIF